jgi:hypothetical protein
MAITLTLIIGVWLMYMTTRLYLYAKRSLDNPPYDWRDYYEPPPMTEEYLNSPEYEEKARKRKEKYDKWAAAGFPGWEEAYGRKSSSPTEFSSPPSSGHDPYSLGFW